MMEEVAIKVEEYSHPDAQEIGSSGDSEYDQASSGKTAQEGGEGVAKKLKFGSPSTSASLIAGKSRVDSTEPVVFPPLSEEVISKLKNYKTIQHPRHAILPHWNASWFYWWHDNVMPHTPNTNLVSRCRRDAIADKVLPRNFGNHPKVVSDRKFIAKRLSQITIYKKVKASQGKKN